MFLVTYYYRHYGDSSTDSFHYAIVEDVLQWLREMAKQDDEFGKVFLINSIAFPKEDFDLFVKLID